LTGAMAGMPPGCISSIGGRMRESVLRTPTAGRGLPAELCHFEQKLKWKRKQSANFRNNLHLLTFVAADRGVMTARNWKQAIKSRWGGGNQYNNCKFCEPEFRLVDPRAQGRRRGGQRTRSPWPWPAPRWHRHPRGAAGV